jgi:aspartate carbamoyltransferase catalytic subunit
MVQHSHAAERKEPMEGWVGANVLATIGWSLDKVTPVLDLAAEYKRCIEHKIDVGVKTRFSCLTLFYEPSTRTRLSFESAAHKLGIKVLSVHEATRDSSSRKGETLEDMGRMVSSYADCIVIRHPELGAARRLASTASVPVINAGDGAGEHPTQALLDIFTMREAFGTLSGLRIGLCGDLLNGRTIHSLLRLLVDFGCAVTAIAPEELQIPREVLARIPNAASIAIEPDLRKALPKLDVLYMTRVQKERFHDIEVYDRVKNAYRLERADLDHAPDHLRIMHPLPRLDEIARDVDGDTRARYFVQAANGVPVRMALLSAVLGLTNRVHSGS